MGRVDGKVALITGAARGQGRSHAIRLAEEGADIIAVDLCNDVVSVGYGLATAADLEETVTAVEALDRRVFARQADVRDFATLDAAVRAGVAEMGGLDIVSANGGIVSCGTVGELPEQKWQDMIDINLTGVWHTVKAAVPHLSDGSSVILTSSTAGLFGMANIVHDTAAGIMRSLAHEVAPRMIRVNTVHPTSVNTPTIQDVDTYRLFRPDLENPVVEPIDVSNAVLFLASDEARFITGATLPVDAGALVN